MTLCRILLVVTISAVSCLAEDAPDTSKFETAKATYEAEAGKIHELISDAIDQRVAKAQRSGQPQAVAVALAEQEAFVEYGDIPPTTPASQQRKLATLAKFMDDAYSSEVKALTKAMKSAEAAALVKEQQAFRHRIALQSTRKTLMGTWKLKMSNYSTDFTFFPDGTMYHSTENHRAKWHVDLETNQIIVLPPGGKGRGDRINLPLNPRGTEGISSSGGTFKLTKK